MCIEALIQPAVNLNIHNDTFTLVGLAAFRGHKNMVQFLMDAQAKFDEPNCYDGSTPLIIAAKQGHRDVVEVLLKANAKVDRPDRADITPLIHAAINGYTDVVKLLIEANAKVDQPDCEGFTPLMLAAAAGQQKVVDILLPSSNIYLRQKRMRTVLSIAALSGNKQIAKRLAEFLSPLELLSEKEALRIISVGHSSHLAGTSLLQTKTLNFAPIAIELGGGCPVYWLKKMSKATKALADRYPGVLSKLESRQLVEFLEADYRSSTLSLSVRLKQGLPVLLDLSFDEHCVCALVWGAYFILCNRGLGSRKPIEVYEFASNALDEKVLNIICNIKPYSLENFEEPFFYHLPESLSFRQSAFAKMLESACALSFQTAGNCSWASPETAVWAFFALHSLLWEKRVQAYYLTLK